jgi:hypothetical protein
MDWYLRSLITVLMIVFTKEDINTFIDTILNETTNIVTCRGGGDLQMDSGLGDWIYCTLYIHTTWKYKEYSNIADLHTVHRSTRTRFLTLH